EGLVAQPRGHGPDANPDIITAAPGRPWGIGGALEDAPTVIRLTGQRIVFRTGKQFRRITGPGDDDRLAFDPESAGGGLRGNPINGPPNRSQVTLAGAAYKFRHPKLGEDPFLVLAKQGRPWRFFPRGPAPQNDRNARVVDRPQQPLYPALVTLGRDDFV